MSQDEDSDDVMQQLLDLPEGGGWVVGAQQLPAPPQGAPGDAPWLTLMQSREDHFVLGSTAGPEAPSAQELLNALVETMFEPSQGEPHRPAVVEMGPNLPWEPVIPMLEQLGIQVEQATELSGLNTAFQYLSIQMTGRPIPGLSIEAEGESPEE